MAISLVLLFASVILAGGLGLLNVAAGLMVAEAPLWKRGVLCVSGLGLLFVAWRQFAYPLSRRRRARRGGHDYRAWAGVVRGVDYPPPSSDKA